ncbi:hypothetical protein K503DRAFT_775475 [Rhizopogon vinicolor AM-OR11-026]|uniref:Uncharacterized protein n=1 Tax=Rhizopogon vinicolor AM-OR11-026 TaxID=1314800 RepID=A0A1B7MLS3_9AGAM|nr:hypothetical protein K503DRAFT_775475 [Rhizopogon vinicolor AM-OR11-026]
MFHSLTRRFSEILRVFGSSALAIIILLNTLTTLRLQSISDHPTELPLRLDTVSLTFNSSEHYGTSDIHTWPEWSLLDHFPHGHGFVQLGPNGRIFGVSMFHQIHCLQIIWSALINGPNGHSGHCLNFLRQAILCNSDITLATS